jgi:hypothetical protein
MKFRGVTNFRDYPLRETVYFQYFNIGTLIAS